MKILLTSLLGVALLSPMANTQAMDDLDQTEEKNIKGDLPKSIKRFQLRAKNKEKVIKEEKNSGEYFAQHVGEIEKDGMPSAKLIADWLAHEGLIPTSIHAEGDNINSEALKIVKIKKWKVGIVVISVNQAKLKSSGEKKIDQWKTIYIFKASSQVERENQEFKDISASMTRVTSQNFPLLVTQVEAHGSYLNNKKETEHFQLLHAAQGSSINDVWQEFREGKRTSQQIEEAIRAVAEAFGSMHAHFLEANSDITIIHSDAHFDNIFYNFDKKRVELIDNSELKRGEISSDVMSFLRTLSRLKGNEGELKKIYEIFFQTYFGQLPKERRKDIYNKIVQNLEWELDISPAEDLEGELDMPSIEKEDIHMVYKMFFDFHKTLD